MSDQPLAQGSLLGKGHGHLRAHRSLENAKFVIGKRSEEGLQENDGLTEARVQVIVGRVNRGPAGIRSGGDTFRDVRGAGAKVMTQVRHHLAQGTDLVQELGSFAQEHAGEQGIETGYSLASSPLEICWVKRSRVGYCSMVLGMFP